MIKVKFEEQKLFLHLIGLGIIILILLLLSGCWDRRELENLAIVSGLGIDYPEQGEGYQLSFQIVKPSEVRAPGSSSGESGSGSSGSSGSKTVWLLRSKGTTVFDAIRNAHFQSNRRIFLSHNQVVIIGKKVAEEGILPVVDVLIRDPEPRLQQWLLIAKQQAGEILKLQAGVEKISATAIAELMENYYLTSKIKATNLHDFADGLVKKSTSNTLPIIGIKEENGKKDFILEETGILKEDRLVGYLNEKETRGLLWALGKVTSGIIVVELPDNKGKVSLEIINAKSKIIPELEDGEIRIKVEITEEANLGGETSNENLSSPEALSRLEKLQAKVIEEEIKAALNKAKTYRLDIFGFGETIHRKYHKLWSKIEENWGEIFSQMEVEIKVKTVIRRTGLITRPTIII